MKYEVTINDYNSIPASEYRQFVDKIQDRIAFINSKSLSDETRLGLLKGALLGLLEINPDNIIELAEDDEITWGDDDEY